MNWTRGLLVTCPVLWLWLTCWCFSKAWPMYKTGREIWWRIGAFVLVMGGAFAVGAWP